MTNTEKLEELKKVQNYKDEIAELLVTIISNTSDKYCCKVFNFTINDNSIDVIYSQESSDEYCSEDTSYINHVKIPIEWLNEEFDYKSIYEKSISKPKKDLFKFGCVKMEKSENPIVWDALSKEEFDFIMRAKNVYEQCLQYSGKGDVYEVNSAAGNILNSAYNFLFSFTENGLKPGYMDDLDESHKDEGGWKAHCRKMTEEGIERALKALKD